MYSVSTTALSHSPKYVALPAGLIRGALARIGLHGTVTTEITSLPHCMFLFNIALTSHLTPTAGTFQIKLPKNS